MKIISILSAALVISSCRNINSAIMSVLYVFLLTLLSGITPLYYIKKIYYPLFLMIPLFIFLPVSSGGKVLFSFLSVSVYKEGIILSLLISLKVIAIVILINIMLSTAPFRNTTAALKSMKVPDKMLNIILFTYRYFFVYFEDLRKMRVALTLRGFRNRSSLRSLRSSAHLAGSLLVRSYEQTERIYMAMLLRGYSGRIVSDIEFKAGVSDIILSIIILIIPLIILFTELQGLLT